MLNGGVSLVGGVLGYFALAQVGGLLPFVLAIAASNFMYIALSDLIPQLHAQADGAGSHGHGHSHAAPRNQPQAASAHGDAHHSHDHAGHDHHHDEDAKTSKVSAAWLQPILMLAGVGLAYVATSLLHSH